MSYREYMRAKKAAAPAAAKQLVHMAAPPPLPPRPAPTLSIVKVAAANVRKSNIVVNGAATDNGAPQALKSNVPPVHEALRAPGQALLARPRPPRPTGTPRARPPQPPALLFNKATLPPLPPRRPASQADGGAAAPSSNDGAAAALGVAGRGMLRQAIAQAIALPLPPASRCSAPLVAPSPPISPAALGPLIGWWRLELVGTQLCAALSRERKGGPIVLAAFSGHDRQVTLARVLRICS